MVRSIISFSSIPFIPILMSRIDAPFSSCSNAMVRTRFKEPSFNSACSFFFPVGLIRSPMTIKRPSSVISTDLRSEVSILLFVWSGALTGIPFTASFKARCSGVVPQHPPMMAAPSSTSFFPTSANSSGSTLKTVWPSISSGIPAFGFARSGIAAYSAIFAIGSNIASGPVEQFIPTASAPRLCITTTAVTGSVPYSVLPSSL